MTLHFKTKVPNYGTLVIFTVNAFVLGSALKKSLQGGK